jgi:hypothetical protein
LWVLGGNWLTPSESQPAEVLRAAIRCDGSLGEWITVKTLPRPAYAGVAGIIGDTLLVVGGEDDVKGPTFADFADYATFDSNGGLGPFLRTAADASAGQISRTGAASDGTTMVVGGGYLPLTSGGVPSTDDGGPPVTAAVTQWTLKNGVPSYVSVPPMPVALSRGGAAIFGNTLFVMGYAGGGGGVILKRTLDAPTSAWTKVDAFADFDVPITSSSSAVLTVGAGSDDREITVRPFVAGTLGAPSAASFKLPEPAFMPSVVVARNRLYVIGGGDPAAGTKVASAPLTAKGDDLAGDFAPMTPLPKPRQRATAFAR